MEQKIEAPSWQIKFREIFKNIDRPKLDIYHIYLNRYSCIPNFLDIRNANVKLIHNQFILNHEKSIETKHSFIEINFTDYNTRNEQLFYHIRNILFHFDFAENTIFIMYGNEEQNFIVQLVESWKIEK